MDNPFQSLEDTSTNKTVSMQGNILLALPTNIASLVLADWVGLQGTVRVDTAFCSSLTRAQFHIILNSPECVLQAEANMKSTDDLIAWALLRNCWVGSLVILENSDFQSCENYLAKFGKGVSSIRLVSLTNNIDHKLHAISTHCKHLVRLHLRRCWLDSSLAQFLSATQSLRELRIDFHFALTDVTDTQLSTISCPNLQTLWLEWCTNNALLSAFVQLANQVKALRLSRCGTFSSHTVRCINPAVASLSITNSAIFTSALLVEVVNQCPNITYLDLSTTEQDINHGIEYAAQHLMQLQAINLSYNQISDSSINALARYRADTLTELYILPCVQVTPDAINNLLRVCTKLRTLALSNYNTTGALDASLMHRIKRLYIACDDSPSRDLLHSIAQYCAKLVEFRAYITDYDSISELDKIVQRCYRLSHMNVEYERQNVVTQATLAKWSEWRQHLKVSVEFNIQSVMQSFGGFA